MNNEMFVKEMQILWQNSSVARRRVLGKIIRGYFGMERGSRIIGKMQGED